MSYLGLETVKPTKPMKRGDLYSFPITTIDQIITDEATDERLPEYLDNLIGMDLLWTNASPTSSFASQIISMSLDYDEEIFIDFKLMKETTNYKTFKFKANGKNSHADLTALSSDNMWCGWREVNVSTTGVNFSVGYWRYFTQAVVQSDDYMIPLRIYKGK